MNTDFIKAFFAVILFCLWSSFSSVYAQQTGNYESTILFNGAERTLAYYVPSSYDPAKKYPLIVGLHFCGGTAEGFRNALMSLADSVNAIVACPEGPASDEMSGSESIIIPVTIDTVVARYSIDTTQVILTGFSCNGRVTFEFGLKKIYPFKGIIPFDPYVENPRDSRFDLDSDMPVSICVTSNDLTFDNTLLLYDSLLAHGADVTINIMKPVGHTYDFPEFTAEMLESYRMLYQDRNLRLRSPESVVFDTITGSYLVSTAYDKRIIRTDGNPLSNQIFTGSNLLMPLGMTILDSIVYVADSGHVKGFHVQTAEMVFDLVIPGAILCNGITSDADSILFVSDFAGNRIYRINVSSGDVRNILPDYSFTSPNGVEFDPATQTLMIVCSGNGEIVRVDPAQLSVRSVMQTGLGGLDGLALDKFGNVYVSSWSVGCVYRIEKDLTKVLIAKALKGPADLYVNDLSGMLVIPDMKRNLLQQVDIYPFMDAIMFRGNAQHNRANASKTGVKKNPEVKWKFKTGGPVVSSPVLAGTTLYVGSNDSCMYALDTLGNLKWKFKTDGIVTSSPAIYCSRVYFTSFDGKLYCLDADSGAKKWEFTTLGERLYETDNYCGISHSRDAFDFFLSSPAIFRDNVYFGSGDGNLYAVDAATGVKRWSYQTGDVVHTSPAIANDMVYFGSWDRYFYALDAFSGELKWKVETGNDQASHCMMGIQSSAVIASNAVYFGCRDAGVYSLKASTGELNWKYSNPGGPWVLTTPAYYSGKVYFGTSDSRAFTAVKADGSLAFSKNFLSYIYSSPAVWTSYGYFGTCGGRLFCADLKTGDRVWEFKTEGAKADPDDMLNDDGTFKVALDMSSESSMFDWMNKLYRSGIVLSSPLAWDGAVYFGSTDGYLYALKEGSDTASSVKDLRAEPRFELSPNPCSTFFTIPSVWDGKQITKIEVYTILGELLISKDLSDAEENTVIFYTGDLTRGICLVTATLNNGRSVTGKLVVE